MNNSRRYFNDVVAQLVLCNICLVLTEPITEKKKVENVEARAMPSLISHFNFGDATLRF